MICCLDNRLLTFILVAVRLSSNNALYGHSVDTVASHYEEEEPFESLEELEAQTIGNLLPNDDDLFSGVSEGLDFSVQPNVAEEAEELDVFSSVGGMDLDDHDPTVGRKNSEFLEESHLGLFKGLVEGEHPCAGKQIKVEPCNPGDLRKWYCPSSVTLILHFACSHSLSSMAIKLG